MATVIDSLTAVDIAAGVRAGEFSAVEVTRAALSAIDARESEVQAFLQVTPEVALGAAARVDALRAAGEPLPPLALSNAASARDGQFRVPSIRGDGGER